MGWPDGAQTDKGKRTFWSIISSTATTLCAFLPMLFWPGIPGEFIGMLPVTLISALSASLVVALIYLPVMGASRAEWATFLAARLIFLFGFCLGSCGHCWTYRR